MNISFASKLDIADIRHIWKECFGDTDSYMDAFFSFPFKAEQTLVAKEDGLCIGALQMFPHTVMINGTPHKGVYIGGVSVLPQYRMQGIAKKLMETAEAYMQKENTEISFLVPFSFDFYRKMGYKCISYLSEFTGKIESLEPFILPCDRKDSCHFMPTTAYRKFVQNCILYLERDDARFTNEIFPLCENCSIYLLPNDSGYIIYEIKDKSFKAAELAYADESSLRLLLGYIYSKKSICDSFTIRTSADGVLRRVLCENNIAENRFPHAMAKTFTKFEIEDSMQNYINMLGWF